MVLLLKKSKGKIHCLGDKMKGTGGGRGGIP